MIGASKILTVSYGTFSCTLEGFDDPFNTMKAIAEYFRDLAAEDRYFGAEPPTPDAAMLHRIAEREVQRRVEAKVQDNGVILRAHADIAPSALTSAPAAPAPAAITVTPVAITLADSLADVATEDLVAAIIAPAPQADSFEATLDLPGDDALANSFADVTTDDAAANDVTPFVQPTLHAMPEGVAARLAKIRAAVAMTDAAIDRGAATTAASAYAEDQHADEAFAAFDTFEEAVVEDVVVEDVVVEHVAVEHICVEDAVIEEAVAEDSVGPSVFDMSFAAPKEVDETADLAALDGVSLADTLDTAPVIEPAVYANLDTDSDDAFAAVELAASDTAADMAQADDVDAADADDSYDALYAGTASDVAGADDLPDQPYAEETGTETAALTLADEQDTDDDLMITDLPAPADVQPDTAVSADFADADDDVLASLSAALGSPEAPVAPADADTIVFNDDADLVLADLVLDDLALHDEPADPAQHADDLAEPTGVAAAADHADAAPVADDDVTLSDAVAAAEIADQPDAVVSTEPPPSDKLQRARARIIRVRRAPDAVAPLANAAAGNVAALSDEAEAELQRELAALEEAGTDTSTPNAAPTQDADDDLRRQLSAMGADDTTSSAAAATSLDPTVQDESLRRLMDQTQSEMAEPGNRRRLSSIAHLKAAVAATIADRFGTRPKPVDEVEATRTEPYRNDLARAVRPVRPTSNGTAAGATERPTPLVLVSEQRIDRPAPVPASVPVSAPLAPAAQVTPVRPRRVSALAVQASYDDEEYVDEADDTDNIFGDAKGFSEFADRIGATELPELLEAAAAYSAAVEGREHFTRPQLLRQIASVTGADISREDELRGFGTLLRDGRIVKVKRGQFALNEQSGYLEEARKISG